MRKNIKYIGAWLLSSMLFASCSDSFLTEANPNEPVESTFWVNETNVKKGLVAVYNHIRDHMSGYYGVFSGIWNNNMRADDLYPTRNEDAWTWGVVNFTNTTESGNGTSNIWNTLYEGISYANNFLYYAPTVEMNQGTLNEMMGEAYFLRGFHYFLLHINFRDAVIRTLPMAADAEQYPLSSGEDVLAQCEADFKMAKELLPATRPTTENGRILKGAASAMLGKTYLWQKRYEDAKKELGETETNYGYELVEYEDHFRNDTEFNKESVYELNYANIDGTDRDTWGDQTGASAGMMNNIAQFFAPECEKGGWYKMQPSAHLIKEFVKEERPENSDSRFDKRLYTTCFFPHSEYGDVVPDETAYQDKDGKGIDFETMWTACGKKMNPGPDFPQIDGKEGRFLMKKWSAWWCDEGASMYSGNKARDFNLRVMRFAEVLLLHAEACLQLNDVAGAMTDINKIRERAGLPAKTIADVTTAWEELRHQKLLEFAGENIRWYDLIRWYDTYEELKAYLLATKDAGQNISAMLEKHRYLPIPQGEVDANQYMEQKPEWR